MCALYISAVKLIAVTFAQVEGTLPICPALIIPALDVP